MPSDQVRFVLESIASIAGIAALAAIALELLRARRADARDFLFHTQEKFDAIYDERRIVMALELKSLEEFSSMFFGDSDEELRRAWVKVFNFWDMLTRTVRANAIDEKMALEHFGRVFIAYYEKFSPVHKELVEIESGFDWYENFNWFAAEYMQHHPNDLEASKRGQEYFDSLQVNVSS